MNELHLMTFVHKRPQKKHSQHFSWSSDTQDRLFFCKDRQIDDLWFEKKRKKILEREKQKQKQKHKYKHKHKHKHKYTRRTRTRHRT